MHICTKNGFNSSIYGHRLFPAHYSTCLYSNRRSCQGGEQDSHGYSEQDGYIWKVNSEELSQFLRWVSRKWSESENLNKKCLQYKIRASEHPIIQDGSLENGLNQRIWESQLSRWVSRKWYELKNLKIPTKFLDYRRLIF